MKPIKGEGVEKEKREEEQDREKREAQRESKRRRGEERDSEQEIPFEILRCPYVTSNDLGGHTSFYKKYVFS